jgi:hypothetical protein
VIDKRGKKPWYRFIWDGKLIGRSTRQVDDGIAWLMESAHRNSVPALVHVCNTRVIPWAKNSFEKTAINNWCWHWNGIRALPAYKKLASAKLDDIGNEIAAEFTFHRFSRHKQVSSVNGLLRVLRHILRLNQHRCVIRAKKVKRRSSTK